MRLEPGDIFMTHSPTWLGRAIRWATRDQDGHAVVNHVGCIVEAGDIRTVRCIEAQRRVMYHGLWGAYADSGRALAVFRPVDLHPRERDMILRYLHSTVGRTYGYAKLLFHLARRWGPARSVIDWAAPLALDKYPICSYLVAQAYANVGLDFGVYAKLATPDDIWDFCTAHPEKYELIHPLGELHT